MAKRKRLNIVLTIKNSKSRAQSEEQRATSAQHHEQSQAQQSQQSEEVQGVVGEQSQPSSGMIFSPQIHGSNTIICSSFICTYSYSCRGH
ncbi:hypothetical protein HRI_000836000 [Hibiscus trionum]|uniref:Uncharacterized protein n=1 Tax=Hibiscus trionum TaxID=183268 RepID=A0A9W7H6U3_HIBTR|nr:hypothetical protein HRI_000836000 [Hibiscus trionum]